MNQSIDTKSSMVHQNPPLYSSDHWHSISQWCNTRSCIFWGQNLERILVSALSWFDTVLASCGNIVITMPIIWLVSVLRTHDSVWKNVINPGRSRSGVASCWWWLKIEQLLFKIENAWCSGRWKNSHWSEMLVNDQNVEKSRITLRIIL